jgi:hypothetical protein
MTRIHLTIDRLILPETGLPETVLPETADRQALVASLEAELRRILADPAQRAAWAKPHRTPVLRLPPIPLEKGIAANRTFGTKMARAIGKGLQP